MYVCYCILKSMTFHINHYTVHILRGGKFTVGGMSMNRHNLLSLESKQSNIYHCTVCITIMAKFTNYWLLPCRISYIIPYLFVYYLSDLKLRICDPLCVLSCFYWAVTQCRESENLDLCILYILKCNISFFDCVSPL